jgi:hypothetical protein
VRKLLRELLLRVLRLCHRPHHGIDMSDYFLREDEAEAELHWSMVSRFPVNGWFNCASNVPPLVEASHCRVEVVKAKSVRGNVRVSASPISD